VPHHGSRTSSSEALIRATRPELAIISASYHNRWGFPSQEIVNRWRVSGARVLNTATAGAISQRICAEGDPGPVRAERIDARKYWRDGDA
jgi:competence protein ComEC